MGKSQKKGYCGAFLRCDRILLSRQRQDTIKRHRAANTAVKRAHKLRDDGRGKIATQPPPRKPSPRAGAFLRCDRILLSRQRQDTFKRTARRRRVVDEAGNLIINLHLSINLFMIFLPLRRIILRSLCFSRRRHLSFKRRPAADDASKRRKHNAKPGLTYVLRDVFHYGQKNRKA